MERVHWIGAAAAVVVAVFAGVWFGTGEATPPPPVVVAAPGASAASTPATLTVHVSGAVRAPGLVRLVAGARVADAVAGAGGLATSADPGGLNLAAVVTDGLHIVVPAVGERAAAGGPGSDGKVRINAATAAELEALPGVGPVLAERIASYRDEHGPFATVEDLLDVPGIGEAKLAGMRDAVAVP